MQTLKQEKEVVSSQPFTDYEKGYIKGYEHAITLSHARGPRRVRDNYYQRQMQKGNEYWKGFLNGHNAGTCRLLPTLSQYPSDWKWWGGKIVRR